MRATSASASVTNWSSGRAPQVAFRAAAHRDGAVGRLPVADHQHVGDLLQLGLANLVVHLFLAVVELDPEPAPRAVGADLPGVVQVPIGNRQDDRLHRRQPERERAGEVLDQDGDEALEAAEDGAVDHHRPVLGVVGADVVQVEALGHRVIELDRAALPLAAERVGDVEVDLRPVERAVAGVDRVGLPAFSSACFSAASASSQVAISPRNFSGRVDSFAVYSRPKSRRRRWIRPSSASTSDGDLLLHHEAVAIVLRELAHARQARRARPRLRCGAAASARESRSGSSR